MPLKETKRSPDFRPALAAGLIGSEGVQARPCCAAGTMHAETTSTWVCTTSSPGLPTVANSPAKMKNAIIRFTVGPPAITTTFFHQAIL